VVAVIPLRDGISGFAVHDRKKFKWRHLVENFFCSIKAFRRIAMRYEKTDKCLAAMVNLVATVLLERGRHVVRVVSGPARSLSLW
jgi:transposase